VEVWTPNSWVLLHPKTQPDTGHDRSQLKFTEFQPEGQVGLRRRSIPAPVLIGRSINIGFMARILLSSNKMVWPKPALCTDSADFCSWCSFTWRCCSLNPVVLGCLVCPRCNSPHSQGMLHMSDHLWSRSTLKRRSGPHNFPRWQTNLLDAAFRQSLLKWLKAF
jgi:hypothetical protein